MNHAIDPLTPLVVVRARLKGPQGESFADLAIDTGSSYTVIGEGILRMIGAPPEESTESRDIVTGSRPERMPQVVVNELDVLEHVRTDFPVLCHSLPADASVDGVLGLDFFRGLRLVVDLRQGLLTID